MRENKTCPDQEWKQLPTDELDCILQAELEKKYPNEEVVLPILRILEEREKDYPVEETPDVLPLLEKLSERKPSTQQMPNRNRWIPAIAAFAAAVCIVVMALPRTVGAESIFDVLFRWTSSVFEFIYSDSDEKYPDTDKAYSTDNIALQQLYNKVTELGVAKPVVPMWIPEDFALADLMVKPLLDNGYKVIAVFERGGKSISISYRISRNVTTKFEKEETDVEVLDVENISHFIMDNDKNLSAAWTVEGAECSIVTDLDKENLYNMIKSIYRRPLK